jgi:phage terminase large subunit
VEGMLASGHTRLLMLSQPTQLSGWFYEACTSGRGLYNVIHIDAFQTPNLEGLTAADLAELDEDALDSDERPYLIKRRWVLERYREWGPDSYLYQVRVRGEFPDQASDAMIRLSSAERAIQNQVRDGGYALGVDVARYGSEFTAFSLLKGNQLIRQWRKQGQGLMETTGEIANLYHQHSELAVVVDDTGLGGGVVDRLKEQDIPVTAVNFGERPKADETCANRATEVWWELAQALEKGELAIAPELPTLRALIGQLVQATYTFESNGRRRLHKKGRDDHLASPDLADSLALAWSAKAGGTPFVVGMSVPRLGLQEYYKRYGVSSFFSDRSDYASSLFGESRGMRTPPPEPEPEPPVLECPGCGQSRELRELSRTGHTGYFLLECECGYSRIVNLRVEPDRHFRFRNELE